MLDCVRLECYPTHFIQSMITTIGNHATNFSIGCTESNITLEIFLAKKYPLHTAQISLPQVSKGISTHGERRAYTAFFFLCSGGFFLFIFAFSGIVFLLSRLGKTSVV